MIWRIGFPIDCTKSRGPDVTQSRDNRDRDLVTMQYLAMGHGRVGSGEGGEVLILGENAMKICVDVEEKSLDVVVRFLVSKNSSISRYSPCDSDESCQWGCDNDKGRVVMAKNYRNF